MSYRRTVHKWDDNSHMYGFDSTVICLNISSNMHQTLSNSKVLTQYIFWIIKCMVHTAGNI